MRDSELRKGKLLEAGSLLSDLLERLGLSRQIKEQQILENWADAVGEQIASSARAEKIADGVLFVSCKSSAWAQELSLHKEMLITRLNQSVGAQIVRDIRFSARGYRKCGAESEMTSARPEESRVALTDDQVGFARQVASKCKDEELAHLVERAIRSAKELQNRKRQQTDLPRGEVNKRG
jgi:hypothetical protein